MQQHNDTITITKAVAIILMVTAHAGFYHQGQLFINMFHMPLFFFCSGYCFKEKYISDARTFACRKIKSIYWPFVKFGLMFLAMHNLFFYLDIYNNEYGFRGTVSALYDGTSYARHAFNIIIRMTGSEQLLGGYWFLKVLFIASFLAYFTIKICKSSLMGGGILLLVSLLASWADIRMPFFGIGETEFMAASFFLVGQTCKINNPTGLLLMPDKTNAVQTESKSGFARALLRCRLHRAKPKIVKALIIVLLFAITAVASIYMPMSMLTLQAWGIVPYFLVALCGTIMTILISMSLSRKPKSSRIRNLFIHIGDHTLDILTWHMLSFKMVSLMIIWMENRPIRQLACFPVIPANLSDANYFTPWWPTYLVAGISIPLIGFRIKTTS